jgi:hypothetical protein
MAKSRGREIFPASEEQLPFRALLIEIKGKRETEDGTTAPVSTETFAALSIEEVIAYLRTRQPNFEVTELRVLGKVQVLSSSENLE